MGLNSASVIFHLALFWIFFKSAISQNDHKILENDPLMGDPKKSTDQQPTFFQKVDLILGPSPIHKDENDRKWIL